MPAIPRVLHISTHDEACGIGKPQEKSVDALNSNGGSVNTFYPLSLNQIKVMNDSERKNELERLRNEAKNYDIAHIQHEFGLFNRQGVGFGEIMDVLKTTKIKTVVSIHTAPQLILVSEVLFTKSPRGIASLLVRKIKNRKSIKYKLKPLTMADKVITFNNFTKDQLASIVGVKPSKIVKTMLPVPDSKPGNNERIRGLMRASKADIILCNSGFINQYKGFDHAVKALKYLPPNYKLAILGGINPDSGDTVYFDHLCDLIVSLGLEDRVYISGYIDDEDELAELIQGCDIALYPYNPSYYKMASSGAINKAIGCRIPVIAYSTGSLQEINQKVEGTIVFTDSPNYYELARCISSIDRDTQVANEDKYIELYSHEQIAQELTGAYKDLMG